jgi:hypothetical protein
MKKVLFLGVLFLSSCFTSKAEDTILKTYTVNDFQYRCASYSYENCGLTLFNCQLSTGQWVKEIRCATNVIIW